MSDDGEIIGSSPPDQKDPRWHIRVRSLTKRFGANLVLDKVDLDLERYKVNVILGASGAGKSVLIKHFMCLLRPDSGHIYVDGTDVLSLDTKELAVFRRKFGLVFQFAALFDSLTVEENCMFPLKERGGKTRAEMTLGLPPAVVKNLWRFSPGVVDLVTNRPVFIAVLAFPDSELIRTSAGRALSHRN